MFVVTERGFMSASRWVLQQTANGARVLEINTDITIRKQAQRASQPVFEERFRLLVEGVKDYGAFFFLIPRAT